ncbi:MAG: palmitoyltransferase [Marteilia pararefringens]
MCCILVMRKGLPANSAVFITNLIVNEILDMRESSQNKLNLEVFLRDCLWKYENYDSTNELSGLNGCLDELKVIMSSSVQQAIEKGGKLDDLVNECQQLDELTRQYVLKTKKLNACCNWW